MHTTNGTPPRTLLPLLERCKRAYLLWFGYLSSIPKTHRYSLGLRIDTLMIEVIEAVAAATYLPRDSKIPEVHRAIRKLDTITVLLMMLWETKSLDHKKYGALALQLDAIGKMLGGWRGQLMKQRAPDDPSGAQ